MRFAVDTGGTFTDLVIEEDGRPLTLAKAPTTPADPVDGVLDVLNLAAERRGQSLPELLGAGELFVHGTTHAINAILTGSTARTAFLTTEGHEDLLVLREGGRLGVFERVVTPRPYISRGLTFGLRERVYADGRVLLDLDEAQVRDVLGRLRDERVEAISVCLLWSVMNPAHELRVRELIAEELPGVPVTLSHELNPVIREYRRASAASIDASLKPRMGAYLGSLERRLRAGGFGGRVLVVTSGGGVLDAAAVGAAPIHSINSGPAMAPVAGRFYARRDGGTRTAIVADVGGTTMDVSLVRDGQIGRTREKWIGEPFIGHMTGFPSVDVTSVAAGGGSIASVDAGGLLHVGPESAGADPGPVCFGRGGTRPTVTDACVVLGRLDPAHFLGGAIALDVPAARAAIEEHVARPLGLDVDAAAAAVLEVLAEAMTVAIEDVTVNQGIDPRTATFVAAGGAGGLNAATIARRLGCASVVIPETVANLSAAGALISELTADHSVALHTESGAFDFDGVNAALDELRARAGAFLAAAGEDGGASRVELTVEARYTSQGWDIEVPLPAEAFHDADDVARLRAAFEREHRRLYAFDDPRSELTLLQWNARAVSAVRDDELTAAAAVAAREPGRRSAHMPGVGRIDVPVWAIDAIAPGTVVTGPAILESDLTTVIVDPGATASRSAHGSIVIDLAGAVAAATPGVAAEGVQMAILSSRLRQITRKMTNTLFRASRSAVINTARDLSCCLVTPAHEIVEVGESLPIQAMAGPELSSRVMLERHPDVRAGDAYLHNSPYHGGSHAGDHQIMVPIVDRDGVHRMTAVVKAHMADIGNSIPTTVFPGAVDVYQEGPLIFPAVAIQRDYADVDDIVAMCELRLRVPEDWRGDYMAMLGGARTAEREILALADEIGWPALEAHVRGWLDYSEGVMAAAVAELPAGTGTAATSHDPLPGVTDAVPIAVTVDCRPDEGRVLVDLTDNPDCLPCGLNLTEATALASVRTGVFSSLLRTVPVNSGAFRRIEVALAENCVVGIPRHPASCSVATTSLTCRVSGMVQVAFAELGEGAGRAEDAPAGTGVFAVAGADPRRGMRPFVTLLCLAYAGGGADPHGDGALSDNSIGRAMAYRDGTEMTELRIPLCLWVNLLQTDSGAPGRFRGSAGHLLEWTALDAPIFLSWFGDGADFRGRGVRGGRDSVPNEHVIVRADGTRESAGMAGFSMINPGDRVISLTAGGGGYGDPAERDARLVEEDLRERLVSAAAARDIYGYEPA